MELTSVYWIPIFELLDARGFTVFLVNARDAKHVPGRKTAALVLGYAHPGCPWVTILRVALATMMPDAR